MKRGIFILLIILFFLIFSYSKPAVTGQSTSEEQYCDGLVFNYPDGTFTCGYRCENKNGCCGTENLRCCSEEQKCAEGLTCNSAANICVNTEETQDKDDIRNRADIISVDCSSLKTKEECRAEISYCDWVGQRVSKIKPVGCEPERISVTQEAFCRDKPEIVFEVSQ